MSESNENYQEPYQQYQDNEQYQSATEAAKRKAEELSIDLTSVEGTGSGGRIVADDVERAYQHTDTTARARSTENGASGQYLVKAYEEASDSWTQFLQSQDVSHLSKTVATLCEAHRRLETDTNFWLALHRLPSELEEHRKEAERILVDFDSFLSQEEKILRDPSSQVHLRADTATRLTNDINFVLGDVDLARSIVHDRPDARAIENLRHRSVNLQNAMCAARDVISPDQPRRRFFRYARYGIKALQFVGAGVVIVVNTSAFSAGTILAVPAVSSVFAGFKVMTDVLKEELKQPPAP